jgi:hypothetical protein
MLRAILSVIAGYLTLAVVVMATFMVALPALGTERVLAPGTYYPSPLWLVTSFALGLLAAVIGGWVCALIARAMKPPMALAVLVVVLGLLAAIFQMVSPGEKPTIREGDVDITEAMKNARQPAWVAFLNPFVGAAGVLIGARLARRESPAAGSVPSK